MNLAPCNLALVYFFSFLSVSPKLKSYAQVMLILAASQMPTCCPFSIVLQCPYFCPSAPDFSIPHHLCQANSSSSSQPQLRYHFPQATSLESSNWRSGGKTVVYCYPFTKSLIVALGM